MLQKKESCEVVKDARNSAINDNDEWILRASVIYNVMTLYYNKETDCVGSWKLRKANNNNNIIIIISASLHIRKLPWIT